MIWKLLSDTSDEQDVLLEYGELHDGISEMIEDGRLKESDIPDDYKWLVEKLEALGAHWRYVAMDDK